MLSVETLSLAKAYTDKVKEQLSVGFTPKIVESLPTLGQNNILYLVLKENGQEEGNIYNEYIWIDNKYEFIGNTDTSFIVDSALSATSENPIQNKVVKAALDKKVEEPSGNGLVRKHMNGVYTTAGVDTTMPTSPTDNNVPTTKLLKDYVGDKSNPLQLSDKDKTKSMALIQHNYDSETSTGKYVGRSIDVNNLSESGLAAYNIPTSKAVISWVKAYIESLNQSGGA